MGKPYQNFQDRLDSKEPQTKQKYTKDFGYYLKFLKVKDPNSLITKKFYSPQETQKIEDRIINYINFLKNQGLNHKTISGRKSAIEFFYLANRINLNWKHISGYIPRPTKSREDKAYTIMDIQKMLNVVTGERDRFLILLLASTGMRVGALTDLKYGDIEPIKPEGFQGKYVYKIIVYRGHRAQYYCFTSFEAAEALDSYTEYRKRSGERITDNSPLLRNPINSNLPWVKPKVKPVKSFVFPINRIAHKAGLRVNTHNRQHQHTHMLDHAFRKFTDTQMIKANVEYNSKEYLLGHSLGLDKHYDRTEDTVRLTEYLKAVELLTISPESTLKKQLAESEITINMKLSQKDKEIASLNDKFDRLIKVFKSYGESVEEYDGILDEIDKINNPKKKK